MVAFLMSAKTFIGRFGRLEARGCARTFKHLNLAASEAVADYERERKKPKPSLASRVGVHACTQ